MPNPATPAREAAADTTERAEYFTPTLNGKVAALKFSTFSGYVLRPVDDLSEATFFKDRSLLQEHLGKLSPRHASDEVGIVPSRITVGKAVES